MSTALNWCIMCSVCDKEHPPPDTTPFNGCPASSLHCFLFVLFPQLYFYSFLDCISTLSYLCCFLPEQRVLIAFCPPNGKVSLDRLTRTMEVVLPHHLRHHRPHLRLQHDLHWGTGKVSWDGLDGLTDCPALPSLPYLLHRLLGGHQDDQDDDDH